MKVKIIVAAHKKYNMPSDELYLPLQVGKSGKEDIGYTGDDSGDNISEKNPYYCELTGLYWAYKNLDEDYIGLVHYRRYFSLKNKKILAKNELEPLLCKNDVILPKKRNYIIQSVYEHYSNTHGEENLLKLREILEQKYPEYIAEFDNLKKRRTAHMFNMLIMKKDILNRYCDWLFDVLFALEKQIDFTELSSFDARLMGRLAELLLDVWVNVNRIEYKEIPFVYTEKINYARKIKSFLSAKFLKKKYDKSF